MEPRSHVNEIVFAGEMFKIGRWRLPAGHPSFRDSGPARHHLFVFPRTSAWIGHAGERPFVADANVVTYYNRGQEYRRGLIAPAGDRCEYYAVDPGVLRQVVAPWDPAAADADERILRVSHGPSDAPSYLTQRAMYSHVCGSSPPDPLLVEETMLAVLTRVIGLAYNERAGSAATCGAGGAATARACRAATGGACSAATVRTCRAATSVAARSRQDLVDRAREIIARRFRSRLTLVELARDADASVFHLCRAFRTVVGTTIHAYREGLRLRAALHAVLDSRAELTEVALDAGYSSHSHFTAAFRDEYGVTPSMLRRGHTFPRTRHSTSSRRRSTVPTTDGLSRPRAATR